MRPIPTLISVNFQPFYEAFGHSVIQEFPRIFVALWPMLLALGVITTIKVGFRLYRIYRLSKAGMTEIDKMSGSDFELCLISLFSKLGYHVEHTGKIGDYGSDLVIERDGKRIAVQAKRYANHVGEDAVREAYSVKNLRRCTEAMVVTNSYFTTMAKTLARSNNVTLWNRDDLVNTILKLQKP